MHTTTIVIANLGFARTSSPSLRASSEAGGEFRNAGRVWDYDNISKVGRFWSDIGAYGMVVDRRCLSVTTPK